MSIAFANLGASGDPDINNSADASSYATASWTPPTTGLIVVFVHSARTGGPDTPTVTGNGLTWTQIGATLNAGSGRGLSLFAANASGATAGITTISFGANTQLACVASFIQVTGMDLSGGIASAFVQQVSNGTTSFSTAPTLTLAAASNSGNRPLACFFHVANETSAARTNWTKADDLGGTAYVRSLVTEWRDDSFETTASASWATGAGWGGMAVELKALVASYTLSAGTGTYILSGKAVTLTYTAKVTISVLGTTLLTSVYETGVSHVSMNDLAYANATARTRAETALAPALVWHRISIHSFGVGDPWHWDGTGPRPAAPYSFQKIDDMIAMAQRMGGEIILGVGNWPWFLKGVWNGGTDTTPMTAADELNDDGRPYTEAISDIKFFMQKICERYMAAPYNIRYWQLGAWEFHGFSRGRDGTFNHWAYDDYAGTAGQADMGMAYLHNQVAQRIVDTAAALGIARSAIKIVTNYVPTPTYPNGTNLSVIFASPHPLRDQVWGSSDKREVEALLGMLPLLTPSLWDIWSWDINSNHKTGTIATDDWTQQTKLTDIADYFVAQVAALGYGSKPYWISEYYPKPGRDPGTNQFVYRAAIIAEGHMRAIKSGVSMALIWSTIGRANDPGLAAEAGLHSDASASTGGQPQAALDVIQMLHDNFSVGTTIRNASVSDTSKAYIIANPTTAMVVNHLPNPLSVSVNGAAPQTLTAYETRLVTFAQAYSLTAGTGTYTLTGKAVNLKLGHRLIAAKATYTLTGQTIAFLRSLRLSAAVGSYTLAGQSVALKAAWRFIVATGTYTLTGNAVAFVHQPPVILLANPGIFALSGQATNLLIQRKLSLAAGTFALSGQAVALTVGRRLVAAQATYALTGQTVTLKATRSLATETGIYALDGQVTGLLWNHRLVLAAGTYALSGQAVAFRRALWLALDTGTYALTGQDVSLRAIRRLAIAQGAYTLTGKNANLVYTPLGHFLLLANGGTYTLAGQSASLLAHRHLATAPGTYVLTGMDITVHVVHVLTLATGHYAVSGQALSFTWSAAPEIPVPAERIHTVEFENRVLEVMQN